MRRIALLIERLTSYKMLAPLADRALAEGLEVWLVLTGDASGRVGPKAYDAPDPARVPPFRNGSPHVVLRSGFDDVVRLCRDQAIDTIFSVGFDPTYFPQRAALGGSGTRWVAVQHASDIFAVAPERAELPDLYCVYTEEWARMARTFFAASHPQEMLDRFVATGATEIDSLGAISPDGVRAKFGLPQAAPVVIWLPHDLHPADAWEILRYRGSPDARALARAVRTNRWDLLLGPLRRPIIAQTLAALRAFCDRNEALLVTKSRVKDRPHAIERELVDLFTYDRDQYPPTILELLSVADLCLHVFSHVSLEAAALGVPSISLAPPAHSDFMRHGGIAWRMVAGNIDEPGGIWNTPGVASVLPLEDAPAALARMDLAEIRMSEVERARYIERFVGPTDGGNSARVLRAAENLR